MNSSLKKLLKLSEAPRKFYIIAIILLVYTSLLNLVVSILIKYGIDYALGENPNLNLGIVATFSILSIVAYGVSLYFLRKYTELINLNIDRKLKSNILRKLTRGKFKDTSALDDGDLLNLLTKDAEVCSTFVTGTLFYLGNMLIPITFGLIYIYLKSVIIGLFLTICLPLLYVLNKRLSKNLKDSQLKELGTIDNQRTFYNEFIRNIAVIKNFNLKKVTIEKNQKLYKERYSGAVEKNKGTLLINSTTEATIYCIEILVLVIGVLLHSKGLLEYGNMFAIWNTAIGSVVWPITVVPYILAGVSKSYASLERIEKFLEIEEDEYIENIKPLTEESKIIIKDLSFRYDDKSNYIISKFNLEIEENKIIFLAGESGCGKSTLLKLILNLYSLDKGEIKIVSKNEVYKNPLDYISYIPQERNVFEGSVLDNLTLGEDYSFDKVQVVMKSVNLDKVVSNLDKGYNAIIGKDINFSLGQEKRIAIARGLLNNKKFILMDEPFSSLDHENSVNILEWIKGLSVDCGFVIVSHNKELNNYADKILNMKELS